MRHERRHRERHRRDDHTAQRWIRPVGASWHSSPNRRSPGNGNLNRDYKSAICEPPGPAGCASHTEIGPVVFRIRPGPHEGRREASTPRLDASRDPAPRSAITPVWATRDRDAAPRSDGKFWVAQISATLRSPRQADIAEASQRGPSTLGTASAKLADGARRAHSRPQAGPIRMPSSGALKTRRGHRCRPGWRKIRHRANAIGLAPSNWGTIRPLSADGHRPVAGKRALGSSSGGVK